MKHQPWESAILLVKGELIWLYHANLLSSCFRQHHWRRALRIDCHMGYLQRDHEQSYEIPDLHTVAGTGGSFDVWLIWRLITDCDLELECGKSSVHNTTSHYVNFKETSFNNFWVIVGTWVILGLMIVTLTLGKGIWILCPTHLIFIHLNRVHCGRRKSYKTLYSRWTNSHNVAGKQG